MIESYQEEVYKKRNAHAIFWGFVFVFAMLLYMFFQGYYFSIEVGFEKLLHVKNGTSSEQIDPNTGVGEQFIKKFGIISLQVNPGPQTLTINEKTYQNGNKQLLDYGKYLLQANQNGYLPITLSIELSQENPFYLNTVNMIREPVESEFNLLVEKIEKIGTHFIVQDNKKDIYVLESLFGSGTKVTHTGALNAIVGEEKTASGKILPLKKTSGVTTGAKNTTTGTGSEGLYLGEGYYWDGARIQALHNSLIVANQELVTAVQACKSPKIIGGEVFCPDTKSFLTGKYQNLKEPILETTADFIRTSSILIRLGGSFFNSSTPITNNVVFSGSTLLVTYKDSPMFINNGILHDIDDGLAPVNIPNLNSVFITKKFGDETLSLGKTLGVSKLVLEDGRNLASSIVLDDDVSNIMSIEQYKGAYIILLPKKALLYYKGSPKTTTLASGDMLGVFGNAILYNRDGKTYSILLGDTDSKN